MFSAACSGGGAGSSAFVAPAPPPTSPPQKSSPIKHIVIIVQENRTVDNLFHGFPGAATVGATSGGKRLVPIGLTTSWDIQHSHADWKAAFNDGAMDGWNGEVCLGTCPTDAPYAYVPRSEVRPYWEIARQYGFANRMFQTQQGPSFPAHQYLISGTSAISYGSSRRASENPAGLLELVGGCDSKPGSRVMTIGDQGDEGSPVFPCFDRPSIFSLLDATGRSWRYYQASTGSGLWNGVDALKPLCPTAPCDGNPEYRRNVLVPSARVLIDIARGNLADVTFVTPTFLASDHASVTDGSGPDWVASVVNEVGRSKYWKSTAIFVTWDDWGGWYDHVKPPIYDSFTDGFRVPLLVISPYAKRGYISNSNHDFGSLLKFTEEAFGLPSLGATDTRSDDLSDFFDLSRSPRKFHAIPTRRQSRYFVANEWTAQPPDND